MSLALEQDLLVGAVLVEILRQHPEIKLNSEFVDAVVVMSEPAEGRSGGETGRYPGKMIKERWKIDSLVS